MLRRLFHNSLKINAALYFLLFIFPALLVISALPLNSAASVSGQILVTCPFLVHLYPQQYYSSSNSMQLNFSANTTDSYCNVSSLSGNLTISDSNNKITDFESESANGINYTAKNTSLTFNSESLVGGTYSANLTFSSPTYTASGTANIVVIAPANVVLSGLTAESSAIGLPLQISLNLHNHGNLSTGAITLYFWNSQGKWSNFTLSESALSPGQGSNISISRLNLTKYPGTYTISAYAKYNNGIGSVKSAIVTTNYTIQSPVSNSTVVTSFGTGGVPGQSPPPSTSFITNLPNLVVTEAPLTTYITASSSASGSMGLQNLGNGTETVSLSIPSQFSKYVQLSQSTFLLGARQTGYINIIANSSGIPAGSYYIPIDLSTTVSGKTLNRTEYYLLDVYGEINRSLPGVLSYVQMLESGNEASVALKVSAPSSSPIANATLTTYIPALAVQNASSIDTYGLASNMILENGSYMLQFNIPYVRPNGSTYIYYQIRNPLFQSLLSQLNSTLEERSAPVSNMQVLDINAPSTYVGQTGTIEIYVLYTGTTAGKAYFSLGTSSTAGTSGITISNPLRQVNLTPNEVIDQSFTIKAGNSTGSAVLDLRITNGNNVLSYPIAVSILPKVRSLSIPIPQDNHIYELIIAVILAGIAISIYLKISKPKARPNVTSKLEAINEKIKSG